MKQNFDQLVLELERLSEEVQKADQEKLVLRHTIKKTELLAAQFERRLKIMQTLSLGMFSMLDTEHIYNLACESIVYQLGWDTAFIIQLTQEDEIKIASFQATRKQLEVVKKFLPESKGFKEAYHYRSTLSTYQANDRNSLDLRVLFQTEELIATPILFGEHLFAYLVVLAHSKKSLAEHSEHDLNFIATLAAQIAQAVQNSQTFFSLEEQNLKLRQLDDLKNSFLSITSHQLRTPLSIVKWILSILQSDPKMKNLAEQKHLIDQAYESNERLIRVVNNLLNVSRIQEGKLPYNPQLIELNTLIKDLCENGKSLGEQRNIKLDYALLDEKIERMVDPILFKEALENLLDNAVVYNQKDGWVRVTLQKTDEGLEIIFVNSGPGINEDEQEKIFSQFYRSPQAITLQPNGNGLGLFLSRAIIREHGGEIRCHSSTNGETVFTVSLP